MNCSALNEDPAAALVSRIDVLVTGGVNPIRGPV